MRPRPIQLIVFLSLIGITSIFGFADQQTESPGETMARMARLGEILATPNKHHSFLETLSGEWKTSTSVMKMPAENGVATSKMILGNRFLEISWEGPFMGIPTSGKITVGYDNYKKKYIGMFIDTSRTSMLTAEGMLDQSKSILSLWGTMDEWMTDEHDKPIMYRCKAIDQNHFVLELHDLGIIPGDTEVVTMHFNRSTE